ncbi:MAG: hypothetical protein VB099_19060 [Candidatus Limiplasma sp.]|nr:hypothetical protein [Candidatus Limiplasma sp.]
MIAGLPYYPAKDIRDLLSHLYKLAMAEEQVRNNLARFLELPVLEAEETTPWEAAEIEKLWRDWGDGGRIAGACLLMIYSGMMPGELFKMEGHMISWETNTILGCGLKTKKREEQPIVFPDFIGPVLRELCTTSPSVRGRVLGMNRGRFYAEFKTMKQRLGIREEVRPYSGRHGTQTALAVKNVPPAVIVEIMRQKNYKTSIDHYNNIETQDLVDALNKLRQEQSDDEQTG